MLVGGGHSHVIAIRRLAMKPIAGLRITLISPSCYTPYSGMLPGLVAGHYTFEQTHIDLARLCQWAGVRFIRTAVAGLNPVSRELALLGRPAIGYDIVSIDIGSQPEIDTVPGADQFAVPVKPVAQFWERWERVLGDVAQLPTHTKRRSDSPPTVEDLPVTDSGGKYRIAVVGGGAGSVELILAMAERLKDRAINLHLYCGTAEILPEYRASTRRAVLAALAAYGVDLSCGARVARVAARQLFLDDDSTAEFDHIFWCTVAAPASWLLDSGLPLDDRGFLAVQDTLQSTGDERVFAVGDTATQLNHPRPKAGVFAVRQGPVLARNLRALCLQKPLRQHIPQRRFLSLLSLGRKSATAEKAAFSATGAWVWHWKNTIDKAFMARFRDLPRTMPQRSWGQLPELAAQSAQEVCGGCGAKVGANILGPVLVELHREFPEHCVAPQEDAVAIPASGPLLQSVDVLRDLVRDPWLMGRIGALHALSDLYACGAQPISCLASITLPFASPAMHERELKQILAGAMHEFVAAGCRLSGGHTMQGVELAIGFTVNGTARAPGEKFLSKRGAKPGDKLLLTKPLGTGALFAGHMQLAVDGRHLDGALEQMLHSNACAGELALAHRASACSDVTGFGLLGHLLEMLDQEQGARIELQRLPILSGALAQIERGVRSTADSVNADSAADKLGRSGKVDENRLQLVFDPQTSGGLLIAVAPEEVAALLEALRETYTHTAVVGEVVKKSTGEATVLVS